MLGDCGDGGRGWVNVGAFRWLLSTSSGEGVVLFVGDGGCK